MPAVTVENTLALPRVNVASGSRPRAVLKIKTSPSGYEGEGFPVRRAFFGLSQTELDPFIHMDQMGEVEYAPGEPKGTPWHPHRGFETVTYLMDGVFKHEDSMGGGGLISDGATQWMTAGSGILHIEAPPEELVMNGGLFHGIQLWVNLPAKDKFLPPAYQNLEPTGVKLLTNEDGTALIRVIAGTVNGHTGPGSTHTPITLTHITLPPGARVELPWEPTFNALAYVLNGRGSVGVDAHPLVAGQIASHGAGDTIVIAADEIQDGHHKNMDLIVLGGKPIGEPVAHYGPFVMNTKAELVQAMEDFQSGQFGRIPHT